MRAVYEETKSGLRERGVAERYVPLVAAAWTIMAGLALLGALIVSILFALDAGEHRAIAVILIGTLVLAIVGFLRARHLNPFPGWLRTVLFIGIIVAVAIGVAGYPVIGLGVTFVVALITAGATWRKTPE